MAVFLKDKSTGDIYAGESHADVMALMADNIEVNADEIEAHHYEELTGSEMVDTEGEDGEPTGRTVSLLDAYDKVASPYIIAEGDGIC